MKIVADENIPLVDELFSEFGEVVTRSGRNITNSDVVGADVLLVRSVTQVNASLLANSSVKFVGTCTIGTDHLSTDYLDKKEIAYSSAPGCNAYGVVQYDFAALSQLGVLNTRQRIGIVGCGNVGGRLYRAFKTAGFSCVCYDPFLSVDEFEDLSDRQALFECDVICVHTPLTKSGEYPTYHMIDSDFLQRMKAGAVLLNAGRGEVVDNTALLAHFKNGNQNNLRVVLDVWEPEPNLNIELLDFVSLATPHIAGYSVEGRINGSLMIYKALAGWLGVSDNKISAKIESTKNIVFGDAVPLAEKSVIASILATHPIEEDDKRLRAKKNSLDVDFDLLRKHYPKRYEFSHYGVVGVSQIDEAFYRALGFEIAENTLV